MIFGIINVLSFLGISADNILIGSTSETEKFFKCQLLNLIMIPIMTEYDLPFLSLNLFVDVDVIVDFIFNFINNIVNVVVYLLFGKFGVGDCNSHYHSQFEGVNTKSTP